MYVLVYNKLCLSTWKGYKNFSAAVLCGRLCGRAVVHARCRRLPTVRSAVRSCSLFLVTTAPCGLGLGRLVNHPRMAGIVLELTHGVPCPGRGLFCPGNVKIDHRAWLFTNECIVFCIVLSVTHDLTWLECNVTD